MKMRDSLRRLLKRHSVEQRNPDTDEPFKLASGGESWLYIDVRKTVLLPHGLYATGMVLMDAFLTDESDDHRARPLMSASVCRWPWSAPLRC